MIFPRPKAVIPREGNYYLRESYPGMDLVDFYHRIRNGNADINVKMQSVLSGENYCLTVAPEGITLTAGNEEGIFRAATSLRQLLHACGSCLPCMHIEDGPQLRRRGYMLDIARGRMPSMDTIRKTVDYLAQLKYNEFQLYMEGDCFCYSAYPRYTEDFECLTPEDIRELNEYCRERFIDLVPNQNSFGHMAVWLEKEEFRHLGLSLPEETGNTLNPLLEESYDFVGKLYESLLPHFTSEYVNIGLDEAYGLGKFQIEEYCARHGKDTVFMDWLKKLSDLARDQYGKKVMFWSDMIYKFTHLYDRIPKDAIALEWGYELIQSQLMTEHCIGFHNAGIQYYVCPSCNTHLSFTGRCDVTSFNIRTAAEIGVKYGAKGLLLTDWGNAGHPQFGVWSLVPIALAGQYGWYTGKEQDGETFKADFIRAAEDYVDRWVFGGVKVARLLYRIGNYYLLEPERVHVGTICGEIFTRPLPETNYSIFFDLKDCGDTFYFNNVTDYVTRVLSDIEKLDFDPQLKREITVNARMVILSSEMCKLRIGGQITRQEQNALVALADWIREEFVRLWHMRNFSHGIHVFLDILDARRAELAAWDAQ